MKDNYPGLAYCNRNGLQIDLLYEAAKQRRAMPLYILYSANRPDYREQRIHMPNEYCDMLLKWCRSCINGVYFTSVYQIRELLFSQPRPQIPDQSILNRSLGLSVLDRFLFDRKELRHMGYYADELFGKRFCNAIDNAATTDTSKRIFRCIYQCCCVKALQIAPNGLKASMSKDHMVLMI